MIDGVRMHHRLALEELSEFEVIRITFASGCLWSGTEQSGLGRVEHVGVVLPHLDCAIVEFVDEVHVEPWLTAGHRSGEQLRVQRRSVDRAETDRNADLHGVHGRLQIVRVVIIVWIDDWILKRIRRFQSNQTSRLWSKHHRVHCERMLSHVMVVVFVPV